jgi:uncharacterized protein (DUF1697 family)
MAIYISILRGINLGGHNTIKMDALKELFVGIGAVNIQTYIQSGNVVYQSDDKNSEELNVLISDEIRRQFGFDVPTMTTTFDELNHIVGSNPFAVDETKEPSFLHVTFLADKPLSENAAKINTAEYLPDEFLLSGKAVYLYCPNGYGKTKLSNSFFERKLKVSATTRNWKTTSELLTIANKMR